MSFEAIDQHHSEVAIFQNDAAYLAGFERFGYLVERNARFEALWRGLLEEGMEAGALRQDLDVDLVYRFVRDTVWVAVRWYRPGGPLTADEVADQYLAILLGGNRACLRPTSSTPSARRSASGAAARRRAPGRPRRARAPALVDRTGIDPGAVDDVSWAASTRSARRPATSRAPRGWSPGCPTTCPA